MMGTQPDARQSALFSYRIDLEPRVAPDHLLRQVAAILDLSFVIPTVRRTYGRSGHVSLDPRTLMKLMLLLFLYDISSERELMEQLRVRLDFLWFLGFDLDSPIPDHSVLSKARARWGEGVFEKLFVQTVQQCVQAGLVNSRLVHVDSTMVKANASKASVVSSGPELVAALRQAARAQCAKLQVLPGDPTRAEGAAPAPALAPSAETPSPVAQPGAEMGAPTASNETAAPVPPPPLAVVEVPTPCARDQRQTVGSKLAINLTHLSPTDPEAELARSKNGVTELNYKDHRMVDDAHGVITAVVATTANVADGTQLPALYEQHRSTTGLAPDQVTVAGDHHYGTVANYLYCKSQGIRAHLGEVSANVSGRDQLPLNAFIYEPEHDRLRCPAGHYLVAHQERPEEQLRVYLIEAAERCAQCALRAQCTKSPRGRSIRRHLQAEQVEAARAEAKSAAGRYSRKRRQHVMEGSFADAANNHGAKRARWRGLWRQQIQSWLIAAVQNLRLLLRRPSRGPVGAAAVRSALRGCAGQGAFNGDRDSWRTLWTLWALRGARCRI